MENETEEVIASTTDDKDVEVTTEDITALKGTVTDLETKNRQLFERAKKAEGFTKEGDEWVKKEEKKKPKTKKSEPDEEFGLLEKSYLRSADIVDEDEVELVKKMMEETGKEIDVLIETKYFKSELEELRDKKTTEKATSDIRGGKGGTKASDSPEYWIAKGVPPTAEQVPDKKTRVAIARAMMTDASTSGKKFYND